MTRYLITGGAGYVGAALLRALVGTSSHVRRMFRGEKALPDAPPGVTVEDVIGDVTSRADVARALEGVDVVIHLAAQTSVYVADADPVQDLQANLVPILNLLEACRVLGSRPTLLLASTSTVYGLSAPMPAGELTPVSPVNFYDIHKLGCERYLWHYTELGHVRGAALRLANVYGPGPKSSRPDRGVLNGMVRRALAGETLKIYGAGEYIRDYVFVDDVAGAFLAAAAQPDAVNGRAFPIAFGTGHTLSEAIHLVARLVSERVGRAVNVEHVEPPAGLSRTETRNFVADPRDFEQATGFRPQVSLEQGIRRTIDYFIGDNQA